MAQGLNPFWPYNFGFKPLLAPIRSQLLVSHANHSATETYCMYVYVCMHACMHVCMYLCMSMYACVCMYVFVCVYVCVYVRTYVPIHLYTLLRVCS